MQWLLLIILLPYLCLLLRVYFNLLKINSFNSAKNQGLPVSVIVPCRNEEENLPGLLSDMAAQDYDRGDYELIIVDDNSADGTRAVAAAFKEIRNLKVISSNAAGKKNAVMTGVLAARSPLVITTDADCRFGRSWLSTIAAFFAANRPDMIICPVTIQDRGGFFGAFQELEFLGLQGVTAGAARSGDPLMCNGANLAIDRESYIAHSSGLNFGLESGDDVFLLHSMKRDKLRILWLESQAAAAVTKAAPSVVSFLRQRSRWISKAGSYTDVSTKAVALAVLAAALLQAALLSGVLIHPGLIPVFLSAFAIKSVPDYLILRNTAARYGKKDLMKWFLPSQFVYPFYVLAVLFFPRGSWKGVTVSSPSPKGT